MNRYFVHALLTILACGTWMTAALQAQNSAADAHVAKAKAAAFAFATWASAAEF